MNTVRFEHGQALVIAHRGLSGIETENTLCAFVAAGNRSYFGIETDVHRTADGHFIVIHDDSTARVAGLEQAMAVEETDLETLRRVTLLGRGGERDRVDLHLPTLREYVRCCKVYEKVCVLELKSRFSEEELARLVGQIRKEDYLHRVIFISFHLENLIALRRMLSDLPLQLLTKELSADVLQTLLRERLDVDVHWKALDREWVERLHEVGICINTWTVDDPTVGARLAAWGVDQITSNILE